MNNIKIQVLGPDGSTINEIETKYPSDQLDRFLSQNRIVVLSDEEPVHFVSEKHRWSPLDQNKDSEQEIARKIVGYFNKDEMAGGKWDSIMYEQKRVVMELLKELKQN